MQYFTILTRGRTGSTPIVDSLNNINGIKCFQEIFRSVLYFPEDFYDSIKKTIKKKHKLNFNPFFNETPDNILPYLFFSEIFKIYNLEEYFEYLKANSKPRGFFKKQPNYLGFKTLFNHLEYFEKDNLFDNLIQKKCIFFLLRRKNTVKEAISGAIAAKRNLYNVDSKLTKFKNELEEKNKEKIHLDVEQLHKQIGYIEYNIERFENKLKDKNANYKIIYYEDFVENPQEFFDNILSKLSYKGSYNAKTSYMKILPLDLREIISNYDEIKSELELRGIYQPF